MAWWAAQGDRPFVFTSTAMVFDGGGPHRPADARDARDDYGRGKIRCEDAVRQAHPFASVARLGWQIDLARGGNTMLATLDRWQQEQGVVEASRRWRPACSFIDDTVAVLAQLLQEPLPGVLHLDSNAQEGWRFDQIARALALAAGRSHWQVRAVDGYRHDQRLLGGPLHLPPLSQRLNLPSGARPARAEA
jgi:dTDP-4-dehydrorhamnose reductase